MNKTILILVTLFAMVAGPVFAEMGCFQRVYTNSHMSKNKNQTVKAMVLRFSDYASAAFNTGEIAGVGVQFRDSGKFYTDSMFCFQDASRVWCGIECDAGGGVIRWKDKNTILLDTKGFLVGADCGTGIDYRRVSDIGVESTTYRLNRVASDKCSNVPMSGY